MIHISLYLFSASDKADNLHKPKMKRLDFVTWKMSLLFFFFFFPAVSSLKIARQENQTEAARCCPWTCQLLFPGVDNSAAKCQQFSFSWTRREKYLQFLVSQGAFQAYSPKLPGSFRQLYITHTGVIDMEEWKRRNDPTTDLSDYC